MVFIAIRKQNGDSLASFRKENRPSATARKSVSVCTHPLFISFDGSQKGLPCITTKRSKHHVLNVANRTLTNEKCLSTSRFRLIRRGTRFFQLMQHNQQVECYFESPKTTSPLKLGLMKYAPQGKSVVENALAAC